MNNYNHVMKLAKELQDEFKEKITLFQSLQIAAQIHQIEVISAGLMVRSVHEPEDKPVALEAIAMVLGYNEGQFSEGSILDVLRKRE